MDALPLSSEPLAPEAHPTAAQLAGQEQDLEHVGLKRVRLLASLTLIAGIGLILVIPFALKGGAEFFLPVTAAMVIAIALVPLLEWFERRGVPSKLAASLCVTLFLGVSIFALASIVLPAMDWVQRIPQRIGQVRHTLDPLVSLYKSLQRWIDSTTAQIATAPAKSVRTVRLETTNSWIDTITTQAPHLMIQTFFALLVIFFFLAGWTAMRKRTIVSRGSFEGALTTARVIQQVVEATSTYLGTITLINIGMGIITATILFFLGMDSPMMWGGIVTVLNYIPYLGPIACVLLLSFGGLMQFTDVWSAMVPPAIFLAMHVIEANVFTPSLVGRKLEINPLLILVSLSFWAWVWGTTGALLAVPLLIIIKTIFSAAGTPDIAGFLFEDGVLTHVGDDEEASDN